MKQILFLVIIFFAFKSKAQKPFFPVFENDTWSYIDYSGKVVMQPKVDANWFGIFHPVGGKDTAFYAVAYDATKGLFGYINRSGKWAIAPSFSVAYNFVNGYAVVEIPCDAKCLQDGAGLLYFGYTQVINPQGKVILKDQSQNPSLADRYWFNGSNYNGLLSITQGLSVGELRKLMTVSGTIVSDRYQEYGTKISSGDWMCTRDLNGLTYFDAKGKEVLTMKGEFWGEDFYGSYAKVTQQIPNGEEAITQTFFIDKTGKKAFDIPAGFDAYSATAVGEGLYAAKKESDQQYYFLDISGKVVLGPYGAANSFNNGLAYVVKDNMHLAIDKTGNAVITLPETEMDYEFGGYQKEGFFYLLKEGAIIGVILKNGEMFLLKEMETRD